MRTMCKLVLVFVVAALVTPGYSISQKDLDQLKALIVGLETPKKQEQVPEQEVTQCVEKGPASASCNDQLANMEARLVDMEGDMDEIISYLSGEKQTDKLLKIKSDKVIAEMEAKVQKTDNVITELIEEVDIELDDLELMIHEVNESAQVTINSIGVVYYGRVGSPCSTHLDDCLDTDAECRAGKCQCKPGYSFDVTGKVCVDRCAKYSRTYQTVSHHIIRGHNNHILNDTDIDAKQCKAWCNEATNFLCKSIDFFPRWGLCFFSDVTMLEVPEEDVEYSSVGVHFQRDCQ